MLPKKLSANTLSSLDRGLVFQRAFIASTISKNISSAATLPPRPPRTVSLAGTVPFHTSYIFLHTQVPPPRWPSVFSSHLLLELKRRAKEWDALANFCWHPEERELDHHNVEEEAYSATLWKMSGSHGLSHRFSVPTISRRNIEEALNQLFRDDGELAVHDDDASSGPYFYICTHGQRDCRCGIRGTELAQALRKELNDRGMLLDRKGASRVGEVGHVGGHKNAPNLLVFPHGDWYGNLEPSDIRGLLDHWLRSSENHELSAIVPSLDTPNRLQWRGRMGMTKEDQIKAIQDHNELL